MAYELDSVSLVIDQAHISLGTDDIVYFDGTEQINRPYHLRIEFVATPSTHPSDWLHKACTFSFSLGSDTKSKTRSFKSVVLAAGQMDLKPAPNRYFIEVGPALALRGLSRRSQVNAVDKHSLTDILTAKLGTDNSGQPYEQNKAAVPNKIRFQDKYALDGDENSGSMIVQFQETDLNYINRICEAAGVFYYFSTEDDPEAGQLSETVNFVDNTSNALPVESYDHSDSAPPLPDAAWVGSFSSHCHLLPAKYVVRGVFDYGPSFDDFALADVALKGVGTVVEFVSSLDFQKDLATLAATRANEHAERQTIYTGASSAIGMAAGGRFHLSGDASNGRTVYFVETVHHVYGATGVDGAKRQTRKYSNSFTCVSASDKYRPPRLLKKPVMPGVYYAQVQSTSMSASRAEISATGRYTIQLRFDESPFPANGGTAGDHSWLARLAAPYGGTGGTGMHFPLVDGTEVLVAFANGDPDRPIIVATIATPADLSPVTSTNNTRNRIVTLSGMMFELDDGT